MQTHLVRVDKSREAGLLTKRTDLGMVTHVYRPPFKLIDEATGEPIVVCGKFTQPHHEIKEFLPRLRYQGNSRLAFTDGLKTLNAPKRTKDLAFGFRPTRPVFGIQAGPCAFNSNYSQSYQKLVTLSVELTALYRAANPTKAAWQLELMNKSVLDHWKMPGGLFTQGIINSSNALQMHFDRGNFEGVWSCMAVFARDVSGGQLVVPAIDAALALEDETYVLFDGQSLLHGVAPIHKLSDHAGRYSIVYYAQKIMSKCSTEADEMRKSNERETAKILHRMESRKK